MCASTETAGLILDEPGLLEESFLLLEVVQHVMGEVELEEPWQDYDENDERDNIYVMCMTDTGAAHPDEHTIVD